MANPVSQVGNKAIRFVEELGAMTAFGADVVRTVLQPPMRFNGFVRELYKLGVL